MLSRILKILAPGENKTSSAAPTKKESPFDFLPEDVRKEYDKLITILPNLLIDKRADKLALGMIKRFLEFVWICRHLKVTTMHALSGYSCILLKQP